MAVPRDVYSMFIEPIRTMDQREGQRFLQRWLRGVQLVWQDLDEIVHSVPNLWSITDCPDEQLKFLKWIVGWTSALDHITRDLSDDELRRLISISGALWKTRGPEDALIYVLFFAAGARCRYWNWFDFRWVLDEVALGEERQDFDPWLVDLPDPAVSGSEYESNLRIVDNGSLDRTLVADLVELMRATGERWETTYLGLLDRFIDDGDNTQWDDTFADKMTVANGVLSLNDTVGTGVFTHCIVPTAIWPQAMYAARVRAVGSAPLAIQVFFHYVDLNNGYSLVIVPEGSSYGVTQLMLVKVELGSQTSLATVDLSTTMPIHLDVYYTFRIAITNEGATGKRIKVYLDGNEVINILDASSLLPEGTMGFATVDGEMQIDEAEVVLIPQDQPPTRAVPVPFVSEWTVAGDATARTVALPLVQNSAERALQYDCVVDWGDGTTPSHITSWNDVDRTHTYASDGTYQMSILGLMEGWSFNGNSDAPKFTKIVQWGALPWFRGFAYLKNGFKGCTNLTSIQGDPIPASTVYHIPGVRSDGFEGIFYGCSSLFNVYDDLFDEHVHAENFKEAFRDCDFLNALPANMFYQNVNLTDYAFAGTFRGCTGLLDVSPYVFDSVSPRNNAVDYAFQDCFRGCTSLGSLYAKSGGGGLVDGNFTNLNSYAFAGMFRGCTNLANLPGGLFQGGAGHWAWQDCFRDCTALTTLPGGLFANGGGGGYAFEATFRDCTALATIGWGLFYYNTGVSDHAFDETFRGCASLAAVPDGLFKTNTFTGGFVRTFYECVKLTLNEWTFYDLSNKFTRFKGLPASFIDFTDCFYRSSFSGVAGKAPELWLGDFDEIIQATLTPATDWVLNDLVTGQTSGHTLLINGAKIGATNRWPIKQRKGTFQLDEVIGVTGVPAKLADQDATHPIWEDEPTTATCFAGAGNSGSSITNYSSIPNNWL